MVLALLNEAERKIFALNEQARLSDSACSQCMTYSSNHG